MPNASTYSHILYQKRFIRLLNAINIFYHSPHKFRYGFAVYALKLSNDIAELKAISQNLMHSNISITDGIYGVLSETDRKNIISGLNQNQSNHYNKTIDEIIVALEKLIDIQQL